MSGETEEKKEGLHVELQGKVEFSLFKRLSLMNKLIQNSFVIGPPQSS